MHHGRQYEKHMKAWKVTESREALARKGLTKHNMWAKRDQKDWVPKDEHDTHPAGPLTYNDQDMLQLIAYFAQYGGHGALFGSANDDSKTRSRWIVHLVARRARSGIQPGIASYVAEGIRGPQKGEELTRVLVEYCTQWTNEVHAERFTEQMPGVNPRCPDWCQKFREAVDEMLLMVDVWAIPQTLLLPNEV